MLALSGRENLDALAYLRFKSEFGSQNVYELLTTRDQIISDKHRISTRHRGNQLFGEEINYGTLASLLRNDAEIRSTRLSEEFDYESYCRQYGERSIPLFAIDIKKQLHFFTVENQPTPGIDWTIISMIKPE